MADFESVGLSESEARRAHRSLLEGRSLSFEDACRGVTLWSASARRRIDETRVRRLAESFAAAEAAELEAGRVPRAPTLQDFRDVGLRESEAAWALHASAIGGLSFTAAARAAGARLPAKIDEVARRLSEAEAP